MLRHFLFSIFLVAAVSCSLKTQEPTQSSSHKQKHTSSQSKQSTQRVTASYYGAAFAGKPTASGEKFDASALTAAHKTLPFGTIVELTNPANGKTVQVRINDRGPHTAGREIDLSNAAAKQLGIDGVGALEMRVLK